jgi:regulation of enolase protein 1 (concanavalin A-like superfamily)
MTDTLWLKAGLEHVNGKIRVSCVVTDPYADWSVLYGIHHHPDIG